MVGSRCVGVKRSFKFIELLNALKIEDTNYRVRLDFKRCRSSSGLGSRFSWLCVFVFSYINGQYDNHGSYQNQHNQV